MIYIPPGGMLVELRPEDQTFKWVMPSLAELSNILDVPIDVRQQPAFPGASHELTRQFVEEILVPHLREHWKRQVSCSLEEEAERKAFYSHHNPYRDRYSLMDGTGNDEIDPEGKAFLDWSPPFD